MENNMGLLIFKNGKNTTSVHMYLGFLFWDISKYDPGKDIPRSEWWCHWVEDI
jgi:hypothetical protein